MWKDLSMKDKAAFIKLGIQKGIYNLNIIRNSYNKYAEGREIEELTPFGKYISKRIYDTPTEKYTLERNANFYKDDYLYRLNKHHKDKFTQTDINNAFNNIGILEGEKFFEDKPNTGGYFNYDYKNVILNPKIYKGGLNPSDLGYLTHEYSHGMELGLELPIIDSEDGYADSKLLFQAYPRLNTSGKSGEEKARERRAVNTQLRGILYNQSGLTKEALDSYIDKLSNKQLREAIDAMNTDYLKSNIINFKDKNAVNSIKQALKDVALNDM